MRSRQEVHFKLYLHFSMYSSTVKSAPVTLFALFDVLMRCGDFGSSATALDAKRPGKLIAVAELAEA